MILPHRPTHHIGRPPVVRSTDRLTFIDGAVIEQRERAAEVRMLGWETRRTRCLAHALKLRADLWS